MGAKDQGADQQTTADRWHVIPRTLCFVTYEEDILLLKRAKHKRVFPGYYNGVGGHIEQDENPQTGAIREIHEETGLTVHNVRYCGTTHIDAGQPIGIMLFIFIAEATTRDFTNSDEGTLEWIPIQQLLKTIEEDDQTYLLAEDLPYILPRILNNQIPFFAHVSYDRNDRVLIQFADTT